MSDNFYVSVSVCVEEDYTKLSVVPTDNYSGDFNVVYPTKAPDKLNVLDKQLRNEEFKKKGYEFIGNRELAISSLSSYLNNEVIEKIEWRRDNGSPCNGHIILDQSQGIERWANAMKVIADVFVENNTRIYHDYLLGIPVTINKFDYDYRLCDPIQHNKRVFKLLTSGKFSILSPA